MHVDKFGVFDKTSLSGKRGKKGNRNIWVYDNEKCVYEGFVCLVLNMGL